MNAKPFSTQRWQTAYDSVAPLPDYFLIAGVAEEWHGDRIPVIDPGTGRLLSQIPACGKIEAERAVQAARDALSGPWSSLSPGKRGDLLYRVAGTIRQQIEPLGIAEALDTGKPLQEARASVERAADYFQYYAGMVDKLEGTTVPLGTRKVCFTEPMPLGVTGHITPWNVPVSLVARGLAPALACGNTAVVKPAEETPLTALMLGDLIAGCGLPPGVVNIVTGYGDEAGQALAEHPEVRHLTFTGSVETGKSVMTAAASHVASVTLELGGKSPHLVLADADLDRAIPDIIRGMFKNAGQICSAGTRLLLHAPVFDEVIERLTVDVDRLTVGHGLNDPDMGPLVSARQLDRVEAYVERARSRGIEIIAGGRRGQVPGCGGGFYYEPTIAVGVPVDDELAREEIFGPVLVVIPIDDLDHAITIGNATPFGLAAGVHTREIGSAMKFARGIEAGQVYVNGYHASGDTVPFGGMKDSGIGREKGLAGLEAYSQSKAVTISF